MDHDDSYPGYYQDYNCGDRTIDFPNGINHEGTDYDLAPFPWHMMQNESIEIVAAEDGIILAKHGGTHITDSVLQVSQGAFFYIDIFVETNLSNTIKYFF